MDFSSYAAKPESELDLLTGALLIAKDAYPALNLDEERARIDILAQPLKAQGLERESAHVQAQALSRLLHEAYGLRGNTENYHDPDNSFVNVVLDRKLGIPISLAVVYLAVADRVGIRARGIGFPGHFLVRVDDPRGTVVMDPFFGGELLDRPALEGLLHRVAPRMTFSEEMLDPAPARHVVARMLMNLRTLYAARGDSGRLLVALDRLVDLVPEAHEEARDRGYLYARLGARDAALADFQRYLSALPHADDASEVKRAISQLESTGRAAN